jgi:hypothetical protein
VRLTVRRRTLLASALVAAPALVRAAARPIGWVSVEQPAASAEFLAVFKSALPTAFPSGAEVPAVLDRYAETNPAAVAERVKELPPQGSRRVVSCAPSSATKTAINSAQSVLLALADT